MADKKTAPRKNDVVIWQLTETHGNYVVSAWDPLVVTEPPGQYDTEGEARMAARQYAELHHVDVWKRRFGRPPLSPPRLLESFRPAK